MTDNLSDNELIAEFMGMPHEKDPFVKSNKKYWHYKELGVMSESLQFDTSWDQLMPVVEKIILMDGVHVTLDAFELSIYHKNERFKTTNDDTLIGAVYGPVVEFIKFLNETKPV